jgi:hypothetical protein
MRAAQSKSAVQPSAGWRVIDQEFGYEHAAHRIDGHFSVPKIQPSSGYRKPGLENTLFGAKQQAIPADITIRKMRDGQLLRGRGDESQNSVGQRLVDFGVDSQRAKFNV